MKVCFLFKMEAATGMNMFTNSEMVMSGLHFIGIDFICAALTLAYVARLVFHTVGASNVVAASCCVAKVSLQGQQIARRVR